MGLLDSKPLTGESTYTETTTSAFLLFLLYLSRLHTHVCCMCVTLVVHITVDYFKTLDQQKISRK